MPKNVTVIVLAAGGGTRMRSKTMKVLHEVGGRSMVGHVLTAVRAIEPQRIVAVIGTQREQVGPHIQAFAPDVVLTVQEVLDGTAGAVRVAVAAAAPTGTVVVVTADTPLLEGDSLRAFAAEHEAAERAVSILSGVVGDPTGYGRIVRDDDGDVEAIVEEKDATPQQRDIREINSGILAFDAEFLLDALPRIGNDNAKGEFYLTDTVGLARDAGLTIGAYPIDDVMQTEGANDRAQLAALGREMNRRIVTRWMREGVTVMDPATTCRLVRISPFDNQGRRQTSFAGVEVLPVTEEADHIDVPEADIRIDVFRSSGPGGQSVNTTDSAVRITHLPTGIVVSCQNEKSQLQNKAAALRVLQSRLLEKARRDREAEMNLLKGDGGNSWGSQMRSYVLHPYQMVKDLRTDFEVSSPDAVFDGELDGFIESGIRWRRTSEKV